MTFLLHSNKKVGILLIGIFLAVIPWQFSNAQQEQSNDILARVLNSSSRIPVIFATGVFKKSGTGIVADRDGYIRIPFKFKLLKETISISSMGYTSKEVPLSKLRSGALNTILLDPRTETLKEVTLSANTATEKEARLKPENIVRKAIQRIPGNCPTDPYAYIAYYRDYQLFENEYVNLNEALVEVFDTGYNSDKLTDSYNQTSLYHFEENTGFRRDTIWSSTYENSDQKFIKNARISPLGGNELNILSLHDPIRNRSRNSFSFVHIFKTDFLENHKFKYEGILYRDEIPIYHFSFKTRDEKIKSNYAAEGSIYIAKDSYGIYKLSYKGFERHAYDPLYSLELEYLPKNGKMVLNYISFNNYFQVKSKGNFKVESILLDKDENAFFITFNNAVNKTTIENPKHYRFIYDKRKLKLANISLADSKTVKVALVNGTLPELANMDGTVMSKINYRVKNIEDQLGRKLNKFSLVSINQFREMFVQKVFQGKALPLNSDFINKDAPLSENKITYFKDILDYWVNTPLKLSN
ncbi:MAG: hypothetical protein AB3N14_03700 [Flavobacteriaceae bacterium]